MSSYRGIILDSIHPNIKKALDVETAGFTRTDIDSYKHITTRTPWMRSVPFTVPVNPDEMEIPVPRWQEWVLYSQKGKTDLNTPGIVTQFGRAGLSGESTGLYRSNLRNTPIPGITGITVSNKGDLGTIRRATLSIKCYHEADLHELEMMYMVPGSSILLEWGWHSEEKSQQPIFLGDLEDGPGRLTTVAAIQEEILKKTLNINSLLVEYNSDGLQNNAGLYDGLIGVITKFNWTNSADGSYDIQIDIIAPNSLTLGVPTNTYKLGGNIVDQGSGEETPVTDVDVIYYRINTKSSAIEAAQSKQAIGENVKDATVDVLSGHTDDATVAQILASPNGLLTLRYDDIANSLGFIEFYVDESGDLKARIIEEDPEQVMFETDEAQTMQGKTVETKGVSIVDNTGKKIYTNVTRFWYGATPAEKLQNVIDAAYIDKALKLAANIDHAQAAEIDIANSINFTTNDDTDYLTWGEVRFLLYNNKSKIPVMTCSPGIGASIDRTREISFDTEITSDNEMGISVYGETYVSWRFIEEYIINELFMPRMEDNTLAIKFMSMHPIPVTPVEDQEVTEDDVTYESVKIINNKWIRSLDPRVCILPGQETHISTPEAEPEPLPGSEPLQDIHNKFNVDGNYYEGYIRNILVNINVVREAAEDATSVNDFAMEILSQVSEACGGPWSFKVITNTALQQVMIIDENHKGEASYNGFKEASDQGDTVYKFSGIGTDNICKDVKIQTKLPSELQALAYYASSGATSTTGTDLNMFKLYGVGLRDRLKPNFKANDASRITKEAREKNERDNTYKRYWELVKKTRAEVLHGLDKSKAYREGTKIANNFIKLFISDASTNNPAYGPPIPIDISLTLNGISGIYMGNAIMLKTVDDGGMLPNRYKDIVALQATSVDQDISTSGWVTRISTLMRPTNVLAPVEIKIPEPVEAIPNYVTVVESEDEKEQAAPVVEDFAQYFNHTGIPYVNGVPGPEQQYYKIKGSQSNGLFKTLDGNDAEEFFAEIIFPSFIAMCREAKSAGVTLLVTDSFRSFEKQAYLYQGRKDYEARGETDPYFAPANQAGWSKHQRGIGIDINSKVSKEQKWMVNYAHKFGFKRTVKKEAWHWVYMPDQAIYGHVPKDHVSWDNEEAIV